MKDICSRHVGKENAPRGLVAARSRSHLQIKNGGPNRKQAKGSYFNSEPIPPWARLYNFPKKIRFSFRKLPAILNCKLMEKVNSKTKKHKKHRQSTDRDEIERSNKPIDNTDKLLKKKRKKDAYRNSETDNAADQCDDIDTVEDTCLIGLETLENHTFGNKRKFSEVENGSEEVMKVKKKSKILTEMLDGESFNESKISSKHMGNSLELEEHRSGNIKSKKKKKHKKKKRKRDKVNQVMDLMGSMDATESTDGKNETLQENTDGEKLTTCKQQKKENKRKKKLSENLEEVLQEKEARVEIILGPKSSTTVKKHKKKRKRGSNEMSELKETCNEEDNCRGKDGLEKQGCENVCDVLTANKTIMGKTNADEATDASVDTKTGQWSSVNLGDSTRQNKFFKLLGGFKKGSDTSQIQNKFSLGKKAGFCLNGNSGMKSGGNFAMNKKQEDVYTKSLENEYERAMSMNLNRGVGIGFEKPLDSGKKFYIDTKSSRSVKFDD